MKIDKEVVFKSLYYISIIFVFYFLYDNNYIFMDLKLHSTVFLIISFITLMITFFLDPYYVLLSLKMLDVPVSYSQSFLSYGKTIFAKYIPGKVFMIYSVGYYLSGFNGNLKKSALAIVNLQLVSIWTGLILGLNFLVFDNEISLFLKVNSLIFIIVVFFILFSKKIQRLLAKIGSRLIKSEINLFDFSSKQLFFLVINMTLIYWILSGLSFYFLIKAFSIEPISLSIIFILPLARTIGMIVLFTPGGIGVREGIMIPLLVKSGLILNYAVSVSIIYRLWYTMGEVIMFLTALILQRKLKLKKINFYHNNR